MIVEFLENFDKDIDKINESGQGITE